VPVAEVRAEVTRVMAASGDRVRSLVSDYHLRAQLLPQAFSAFRVEAGGEGAGTVFAYTMRAGGRERSYHMRVEQQGEDLVERDEGSSLVTRWRVEQLDAGRSRVTLGSSWAGAGGVGGIFERAFAPIALRKIYRDMLDRLAAAAA
jgi:hypothetical protein